MENTDTSVKIVVPPKQGVFKEWASDQKVFKSRYNMESASAQRRHNL